mgnify:CR=1 FL=1
MRAGLHSLMRMARGKGTALSFGVVRRTLLLELDIKKLQHQIDELKQNK